MSETKNMTETVSTEQQGEAQAVVLEEDALTVPGQLYACLSFVSPISRQKSEQIAMKIRGVFATQEEAGAHAKRLQKFESISVDVFVAPLYKWLVVPPNTDEIQTQHYQEEFLENLMSNYRDSQEDAKKYFYDRKKRVLEQGIDYEKDVSDGPASSSSILQEMEHEVHGTIDKQSNNHPVDKGGQNV